MPEIKLEHITKRWGKFYAVEDLSLTIQDNAFVTTLGPSGCGKTTVLRMIAGLETPTVGRITIGDRVVFDSSLGINVPPNKRKVGFLFQNYALWPNMTVYQNISFGLTNIKEALPEIDFEAKNAARLAELLENAEDVRKVLGESLTKEGRWMKREPRSSSSMPIRFRSTLPRSFSAIIWKKKLIWERKLPRCAAKSRMPNIPHRLPALSWTRNSASSETAP